MEENRDMNAQMATKPIKNNPPRQEKILGRDCCGLSARGVSIGGVMEPNIKEVVKTGKQVLDEMDSYYLLRQEESTNAGIIVGFCLLIAAIIYFVLLMAPMAHAGIVSL